MSYNIVIGRSFIRTSTGIIPLVLTGDSSLTNAISGDIVRSWSVMDQEMINRPAVEIMEKVCRDVSRYNAPSRVDAFYWRGGFLKLDKLPNWFKRGCNEAHTLEEYLAISPKHNGLLCEVMVCFAGKIGASSLNYKLCKTTSELEEWLDLAQKEVRSFKLLVSCKDQDVTDAYIRMGFCLDQELPTTARSGEKVIAKYGKRSYVKTYTKDKQLAFTDQQDDAAVFDSVQDAVEKLGTMWDLTFVKAPKGIGTRSYVLLCQRMNGEKYYFHYRERSRIIQSKSLEDAKRFASIKEVERYVASLRKAGFEWYVYIALNFKTGEEKEI